MFGFVNYPCLNIELYYVYLGRKKEVNFILSYYTNLSHTGQEKFTSFFRTRYTCQNKEILNLWEIEAVNIWTNGRAKASHLKCLQIFVVLVIFYQILYLKSWYRWCCNFLKISKNDETSYSCWQLVHQRRLVS